MFDRIRPSLASFAAVGALATALACPAQADAQQSLTSIRMQAEAYVMGYDYRSPYPPKVELSRLDSRLRLKACPVELDVAFAHPGRDRGNTVLRIRCPVTPAWKLHLPARIAVFDDVAVAARPLVKGQIIDVAAVVMQKTDVSRLNHGYFAKLEELRDFEARRNLPRGTVLTPKALTPRRLVRTGQTVTLVLEVGGLEVRSSGEALHAASQGQVVRVRNSQSQKIVEGVVAGDGVVRVAL